MKSSCSRTYALFYPVVQTGALRSRGSKSDKDSDVKV